MLCFHLHSILKKFFLIFCVDSFFIQVRCFSFYDYVNSLLFQLFLISLKNSGSYLSVFISLGTFFMSDYVVNSGRSSMRYWEELFGKIFCKDQLGQLGLLALEFLYLVFVWMICLLIKGGIELTYCNCLSTNMWFNI